MFMSDVVVVKRSDESNDVVDDHGDEYKMNVTHCGYTVVVVFTTPKNARLTAGSSLSSFLYIVSSRRRPFR